MSSPAEVLLVTAAGTGSGVAMLRKCREHFPEVRLVAADIHPPELCAASLFCDRFVRVAPAADPGFEAQLLALMREERVTAYLPILDEELLLAGGIAAAAGARTVAPAQKAAETCFDKHLAFRFLREHGIPTVETFIAGETGPRPGSYIAKPRRGRGSIGFLELESFAASQALGDRYVVQPKLAAPEITVDAFLSGARFHAVCRERLETKAGVCTKARVFPDPGLQGVVERLGRALELRGTFCVQLMHDEAGRALVTDVNPRPGAGTSMSGACGVDLLTAHLAEILGRDPAPYLRDLQGERYVVRSYVDLVTR